MGRKVILSLASLVVFAGLYSCGGKGDEGIKRESEAAISEATADGRNAARMFVNREWKDTMELQQQLLEAKARQSKYLLAGRKESAAAFDSAFVSTIKTVRPDIARNLDKR